MKLLITLLTCISLIWSAQAKDVQFCRNGIGWCISVRSVNNDTAHDFYITLRGRVSNGWAATAVGGSMVGSLMFITYPGNADNTTTLSVRTTSNYVTPLLVQSKDRPKGLSVERISMSKNSTYFTTSFVCYGCDRWKTVNGNSDKQPWIYAVGNQKMVSDNVNAQLNAHPVEGDKFNGQFTLDMGAANSDTPGAPVIDGTENKGSTGVASTEWIVKMHALLLGGSFLAIFPAGVLALRSNLRWAVKAHMFIQGTATLFCILGMVLGIVFSLRDPRFQDFKYAHQILGFVIVAWVVLQFSAGLVHHIIYKRTGKSTPIAPAHIWSGRVLLPVGIINGGLGLLLAGNRLGTASYYVLGFLGLGSVFFLCFRWQNARREERLAGQYPGNYNPNYSNNTPFGGPGGVPLSQQPVGQGPGGHGAPYQYGHASQASQSSVWNARPQQHHEAI